MKRLWILGLLAIIATGLHAEIRALWAPAWDITTPAKIDSLLQDAQTNNFNTIVAQVRWRGDALYTPNRHDVNYINPEKKTYLLPDKNFDPLDYLCTNAAAANIDVIAWATVFVVTPNNVDRIDDKHIYYGHPDWFTQNEKGEVMGLNTAEGLYLDPGVPAVQDYVLNIILDIVANYPIKGIQLDYLRYPGPKWGFNKEALRQYKMRGGTNFIQFKEEQVNNFVQEVSRRARLIKPRLKVTAAVRPDLAEARGDYAQDWMKWLSNGWLDYAYVMAYNSRTDDLVKVLEKIRLFHHNTKVVVGLRAWDGTGADLAERYNAQKDLGFAGWGAFSYGAMKKNGLLPLGFHQ